MSWTDQNPQAEHVLLQMKALHAPSDKYVHCEIDKLPDGTFRATVGNLFGSEEVCRDKSLENLLLWFSDAMTTGKRKRAK